MSRGRYVVALSGATPWYLARLSSRGDSLHLTSDVLRARGFKEYAQAEATAGAFNHLRKLAGGGGSWGVFVRPEGNQ